MWMAVASSDRQRTEHSCKRSSEERVLQNRDIKWAMRNKYEGKRKEKEQV